MKETIENFVDPSNNSGQIIHRWVNPETHRGELAEIRIDLYRGKASNIHMSYNCGGCNKDTTQVEAAYAMSYALQLAGARLEQLYQEHNYEGS